MAMSVGGEEGGMMAEINTTPLVDVMLVLLIIFLITIPVITRTVPLQLPKAVNQPTETKPENITIAVDANGRVYWNDLAMPPNDSTLLLDKIKAVAVLKPQPEIHVRADKNVRYEYVGRVIVLAQRGGIVKLGFITEPDRGIRGMRSR